MIFSDDYDAKCTEVACLTALVNEAVKLVRAAEQVRHPSDCEAHMDYGYPCKCLLANWKWAREEFLFKARKVLEAK